MNKDPGYEYLDDTPIALPIRFTRPATIIEQIRNMVRGEISRRASDTGMETFEEADDFDVGDDFDPTSPYEQQFDQESASWDQFVTESNIPPEGDKKSNSAGEAPSPKGETE